MPAVLPSRERGHLAVAALRVCRHRNGQPPRPADIAALLGWGLEETLAVVRGLADAGILRIHETPYEIRLDVDDHRKIEELTPEAEKEALRGEVDAFRRKSKERREEIDRLFQSGDVERRKREEAGDLAKDFEEFRKRGRRPPE